MRRAETVLVFAAWVALASAPVFANPHGKPPAQPSAKTPPKSVTPGSVATKISSNPTVLTKVQALLPSGTTLSAASKGFKNEGQFIAALHASKNLNIPFAQLHAEMTGKDHDSLGTAIHELKPGIDAKAQAKLADQQAKADLKPAPHLNPVAKEISARPQLLARVQSLLPPGVTLTDASKGFKTESQFIAALHAAKNLNIPFAQLRSEMTGKDHDSLGVAVGELKPGVDAGAQAKLAEQQARADLKTAHPAHGE